jgi:hypothetical protein
MQNILLVSARKQGGKSSLCKFLHGYVMQQRGIIDTFDMTAGGDLLVPTEKNGKIVMAILDIERKDQEFAEYAKENIWPWIKSYSFAAYLKEIAIELFGLTYEQCYGTDDDKNSLSEIRWSDISFALPPRTVGELKRSHKFNEFLTARELLENFGTKICRQISDYCWTNKCLADVKREEVPLAIICDGRFPNEITRGAEFGAKSVRLARNPFNSASAPEVALDSWKPADYDLYVDNRNMSLNDKNVFVLNSLIKWGWI